MQRYHTEKKVFTYLVNMDGNESGSVGFVKSKYFWVLKIKSNPKLNMQIKIHHVSNRIGFSRYPN